MKKVLQRLVAVPMTLDLLQVCREGVVWVWLFIDLSSVVQSTHIGKEVNGLRKREGEIGKTAKQLVKSWKQLLVSSVEGGGEREGGRRGEREGGRVCGRRTGREEEEEAVMEEEVRERRRETHSLQQPQPQRQFISPSPPPPPPPTPSSTSCES